MRDQCSGLQYGRNTGRFVYVVFTLSIERGYCLDYNIIYQNNIDTFLFAGGSVAI